MLRAEGQCLYPLTCNPKWSLSWFQARVWCPRFPKEGAIFRDCAKSSQQDILGHEIKRHLLFRRKAVTNSVLKSRDITLLTKIRVVKVMAFLIVVQMWELDHKEGWARKNWCFQTVVLEKALENSLDCKEVKSVNPKENQLGIFIGRTGAKVEAPIPWPADVKSQLLGKDPDAGKDWTQEEKGVTEDEMVGWHHQLNWCEFEQIPRDSEGQGSLACCSP